MSSPVRTLLQQAAARLAASPSAVLDAEVLLSHCSGKDRSWLLAHVDADLPVAAVARFNELTARRAAGEPVAYLTGRREFWSLQLKVDPSVLIPRPETELLVELVLQFVDDQKQFEVLDLGTGSGAIALAIVAERPASRVTATDISSTALAVARQNAQTLCITNITFVTGDWYQPLTSRHFDVIVSNPPYVADGDPYLQRGDLPFEPATALLAGADGLRDLQTIVVGAIDRLVPGGWLLLEHGADQEDAVSRMMRECGFCSIATHRDLAGLPRVTLAQLPGR